MGFRGSSPLQRGGANIFQPIGGTRRVQSGIYLRETYNIFGAEPVTMAGSLPYTTT